MVHRGPLTLWSKVTSTLYSQRAQIQTQTQMAPKFFLYHLCFLVVFLSQIPNEIFDMKFLCQSPLTTYCNKAKCSLPNHWANVWTKVKQGRGQTILWVRWTMLLDMSKRRKMLHDRCVKENSCGLGLSPIAVQPGMNHCASLSLHCIYCAYVQRAQESSRVIWGFRMFTGWHSQESSNDADFVTMTVIIKSGLWSSRVP